MVGSGSGINHPGSATLVMGLSVKYLWRYLYVSAKKKKDVLKCATEFRMRTRPGILLFDQDSKPLGVNKNNFNPGTGTVLEGKKQERRKRTLI
jgi:hypothetical protein